jgi:putative transposase
MIDSTNRHRRSIRLKDYDYTNAGAYFVTIVTHGRKCLFGEISGGVIRLNDAGHIVQDVWDKLPIHYAGVACDAFVVMPNHIHGIVVLNEVKRATTDVGAGFKPAPTDTRTRRGLPEILRGFKTFSARQINAIRDAFGTAVWQRNYFEHVIGDENSLHRIRE